MNIVIMQPYFLPYIGYFQLIASADIFVSLDDVNFIKRGWINRNNLYFNSCRSSFSLPLHKASQNRLINEIELAQDFNIWRSRFLRSLHAWYGKMPYFDEGFKIVKYLLESPNKKISDINLAGLKLVSNLLGFKTKFHTSTSLNIPRTKGVSRLVAISRHFGADTYINAPQGKDLYCDAMFNPYGLELRFLRAQLHRYSMPHWLPGLSILDAIMRIGCAETARKLIPGWTLEHGEKDFSSSVPKIGEQILV